VAYFFLAFGLWDIFYYFWLKVFLNWPPSLFTLDVLFLIPVPWVGPVLAPMLVSLFFIVSSLLVLFFKAQGRDFTFSYLQLVGIFLGGALIFSSFIWNFKKVLEQKMPSFSWSLFLFGLFLALISFFSGFMKDFR
jgi:hypothetical protein